MRKSRETFYVVENIVTYVTFCIQTTNLGVQLLAKNIKWTFTLIAIGIVWFICLHVKFVQSNIQDQLLPSLDQDLISINQISNFTEKEGGVLCEKN